MRCCKPRCSTPGYTRRSTWRGVRHGPARRDRRQVHGAVYAFAKEVEILGAVSGNLHVCAESTHIAPAARIDGERVRVYGHRLRIDDGARIAGSVTAEVDEGRSDPPRFSDPWHYVR